MGDVGIFNFGFISVSPLSRDRLALPNYRARFGYSRVAAPLILVT